MKPTRHNVLTRNRGSWSIKFALYAVDLAAKFLVGWIDERVGFASVSAVGRRVVHAMQRTGAGLAPDCGPPVA